MEVANPVRLLLWPHYATDGDLPTILDDLLGLAEAGMITVFLHRDDVRDPAGASEYLDDVFAGMEFPLEMPWGDALLEPASSFDAFVAFGTPSPDRIALHQQLGIPVVPNRYDIEHLCIARGILEPSTATSFCPLPWIHLHLEADGVATPCCVAQAEETRDAPSLSDHTLTEAFNSPMMRRVRLNMLRGERDPVCRHCWKAEEHSGRSPRIDAVQSTSWLGHRTHMTFEDQVAEARAKTLDDGSLATEDISPLSIDIRWSNICNMKCRMCWHRSSSSWFEDARTIADELGGNARNYLVWNEKAIVTFDEDQSAVEKLAPHFGQLEHIYAAGGEPLMMEQHYDLLDRLQPQASRILLAYNTNLSALRFRGRDVLELWKAFRTVLLGISVDGLGPIGEYVRTGFQTPRFLENLARILEFRRTHANFWHEFHMTVSVYNVFAIPDLVREVLAKGYIDGPDQLKMNVVYQPMYASPSVLPMEMRLRAAERYDALVAELDRDYPDQLQNRQLNSSIALYLRSSPEHLFEVHRAEVWAWLERLDRLRSTSWRSVAPHLACFEPRGDTLVDT